MQISATRTAFQRNALDKIRHLGGSIFYADDKSWRDMHGHKVLVPSFDLKTEGFIGWPTITALMAEGSLYHRGGAHYAVTNAA